MSDTCHLDLFCAALREPSVSQPYLTLPRPPRAPADDEAMRGSSYTSNKAPLTRTSFTSNHKMLLHPSRRRTFVITQPRFCISQTLRKAAAMQAISTTNCVHFSSKLISTFTAIRDTERASDRAQEEPGSSWPSLRRRRTRQQRRRRRVLPSRTRAASPADTATLPPAARREYVE